LNAIGNKGNPSCVLQAFGLLTSRRKQNSKKCKKCKKGVELKLTKKKKKDLYRPV